MKIKGKKVVDAKKPLVLHINRSDVKNGNTKQPSGCAAALAALRECGGSLGVRVHLSRTYVEYPDKIVRYITPSSLRTEIVSFDRGHSFEVGEYELVVPPESQKIGANKGGNYARPGRDRSKEKPRRSPHIIEGVRARAPRAVDWK